jgi:hypothetical protein
MQGHIEKDKSVSIPSNMNNHCDMGGGHGS